MWVVSLYITLVICHELSELIEKLAMEVGLCLSPISDLSLKVSSKVLYLGMGYPPAYVTEREKDKTAQE